MMPRNLTVAALVAATVLLGAASAARAGFHVSMSSSSGLVVTTDDPNSSDPTIVTGQLTPEGSVANWDVGALCLTNVLDPLGNLCIDTNDSDCHAQNRGFGKEIRCARTHAGVSISTRGGDDNIHVGTSATDPVSVDAGSGNDTVSSASIFTDIPVGPSGGAWTVTLGSGNDQYLGSLGSDFVSGGDGNDAIDPSSGPDTVNAGAGNDVVRAGPDSERTQHDGYDGGPGFDTLDYSQRTSGIFVAKVGSTGGFGSEDSIANFERILGGSGNDSILGFSSSGGDGNDTLTGDDGPNTIVGGPGADIIRGFGGDDTLNAKDGIADTKIECGPGNDTVLLDLRDPNPTDAQACELIDRRAVDEEPATRILTPSARVSRHVAAFRLGCPRAVHRVCAGKLALTVGRSPIRGSAAYRMSAGRDRVVHVAISNLRGPRHAVVATVTSREEGLKGAETVTRRIQLHT
jgi:Ca2+-binding RTX toxin-like protein